MPRYIPAENTTNTFADKLTTAQKSKLKVADMFVSKWISRLTPQQLEEAIIENKDPKLALGEANFRADAQGLISLVKMGNFVTDLFSTGMSRKSASGGIIEKYINPQNIRAYCAYARPKYPAHIEVIMRLAPQSYAYLERATREMLKDLL